MGQESINNCKAASETVLNLRGIEKACGWREGGGKVHGRRIEHSYVSSTKHNNYAHLCDDLIDSFKCGGCKINLLSNKGCAYNIAASIDNNLHVLLYTSSGEVHPWSDNLSFPSSSLFYQ